MLGPAAIALATVAVASVGFLLLTGRLDLRRGANVIIGCFIVFGAASIVSGIMSVVQGGSGEAPQMEVAAAPPVHVQATYPQQPLPNPSGYDPYAGAALQQR